MSHREPRRVTTLALAAAGGLLTDAAFPDRGLWFAAPVGIALLFLGLRRDHAGWGGLVGFVWGLAFFLPHIHWLWVSVGWVPWVALTLLESALVGLVGGLWVLSRRATILRRRPLLAAAVFAALWVVGEQVRSLWPFGGFPWGRLAFSQADAPTIGLASLGGAPLLSAVVAGVGALLATAWLALGSRPRRAVVPVAVAAVLLLAGPAVPLPAATPVDLEAADEDMLRLGAVQGNVAVPGLDAFAQQREVLDNHVEGTRTLAAEAPVPLDLVLWPENAADVDPRVDREARAMVEGAAQAAGAPILVGTLRYDDLGRYNDSVLWVPGVGATETYTKQHPAPFAEYIPIRSVARVFSDKVDLVRTDMLPGTETGLVPVEVERLGRTIGLADVICFEVAYDPLVRDAVVAGGEVIVVQTNNASFGRTPESTQQLAMTRLRAVEHGRVAVQISTVGVSGVVAPDGSLVTRTGLFTAEQMSAGVPLRSDATLATRLGDAPAWFATVIGLAALAAGLAARGRRARRGRGPEPSGAAAAQLAAAE